MQFKRVPPVDARYWVALAFSSVFGANTGDFFAHNLHLGHVRGLPVLAAFLVLIFIAERVTRPAWEGWYWLAIVTLRTAATNLADLATHDGKASPFLVTGVLAVLLVAIVAIAHRFRPERDTAGVPRTDAWYWLAMLTAGTLGTALGDGIADAITLLVACVVTGIGVLVALSVRLRPLLAGIASYWIIVVAVRTFGTNLGDLIAHRLGLVTATPLTGLVLLLLLVLWRPSPAPVLAPSRAA